MRSQKAPFAPTPGSPICSGESEKPLRSGATPRSQAPASGEPLKSETDAAFKKWQATDRKVWEYFYGQLDEEDMWRAGYVAGRLANTQQTPESASDPNSPTAKS